MDQREDDIRQHIRETRASMTEKLEMLEERVQGTIEGARSTVEDIVGNVKETVDNTVEKVKGTVDDTVGKVKETVDDTFEMVKRTFDLQYQVDQHPWLMFGGAILAGYVLGSLGSGGSSERDHDTEHASAESMPVSTFAYSEASYPSRPRQGGMLDGLRNQLRDETGVLLSATITGVTELLRNLLTESVPQLGPYLKEAASQGLQGRSDRASGQAEEMTPSSATRGHTSAGVSRGGEVPGERQPRHS
ncbi:MAG: YtxH domain-containing protein [Candidatus Entotheonellia bacterium]